MVFVRSSRPSPVFNHVLCRRKSILETVYAVLDLETTGLDRKEDRIVQIGVVKVKNDDVTPWMTYVNPLKSRGSGWGLTNVSCQLQFWAFVSCHLNFGPFVSCQ